MKAKAVKGLLVVTYAEARRYINKTHPGLCWPIYQDTVDRVPGFPLPCINVGDGRVTRRYFRAGDVLAFRAALDKEAQ